MNLHSSIAFNGQLMLSGILYALQCRFDFVECEFKGNPTLPTQPFRCLVDVPLSVDWFEDDGSKNTTDYRYVKSCKEIQK